jgi:hypothetical protein
MPPGTVFLKVTDVLLDTKEEQRRRVFQEFVDRFPSSIQDESFMHRDSVMIPFESRLKLDEAVDLNPDIKEKLHTRLPVGHHEANEDEFYVSYYLMKLALAAKECQQQSADVLFVYDTLDRDGVQRALMMEGVYPRKAFTSTKSGSMTVVEYEPLCGYKPPVYVNGSLMVGGVKFVVNFKDKFGLVLTSEHTQMANWVDKYARHTDRCKSFLKKMMGYKMGDVPDILKLQRSGFCGTSKKVLFLAFETLEDLKKVEKLTIDLPYMDHSGKGCVISAHFEQPKKVFGY